MDTLSLMPAEAAALLARSHGIDARALRALGSELASTFRASSDLGDLAVKIQRSWAAEAPLQAWRAEIAERLAEAAHPVPSTIRSLTGALVAFERCDTTDETRPTESGSRSGPPPRPLPVSGVAITVTRWIDAGGAAPYATLGLPAAFGTTLGRAAAELQGTLATLPRPPRPISHTWAAHTMAETIRRHLDRVSRPDVRRAGSRALEIHDRHVAPVADRLPWALVHQDLHDDNVLATPDGRIAGLIDFDDMLVGWRIAEPAIAAAYFARTLDDPVAGVAAVAAGWAAAGPVTAAERAVLAPLAAMRLALNAVVWDSRSGDDRHGYAADRSRGSLPAFEALATPLLGRSSALATLR